MSSQFSQTATEIRMQVTGIILAGGRSMRMGGVNKALLKVQGRPMLQHIITRLQPQVASILISAPFAEGGRDSLPPQVDYRDWGFTIVCDPYPDYQGPLSGILAGMQQSLTPFFLSVPCDTPFLPLDLSARMFSTLSESEVDLVYATADGHEHPVICMGKTHLVEHLAAYLAAGDRKVSLWQKSLRYSSVDFGDCAQSFCNINTPQDLQELNTVNPNAMPFPE